MPETLSRHGVGSRASRTLASDLPVGVESAGPASPTFSDRIKRTIKNPLVMVIITWVVMAVLLAREILAW